MGHVRFGFAAGVGFAAGALPRRRGAFYIFGLSAFGPNRSEGLSPDQGQSHRREANSGGEAEAALTEDF